MVNDMQKKQGKEFYIVCDCELFFDSQRGIVVNKPTLLYADGTLEIESIGIFPDRTRGKYRREWYRGIQSYLSDLSNPARDLRHDFYPHDYEPTVLDVLWNNPDKEYFSRSELEDLISKRNIEAAIDSARETVRKLLNRRMLKAIKRKSEEDVEFLKSIGEERAL